MDAIDTFLTVGRMTARFWAWVLVGFLAFQVLLFAAEWLIVNWPM